MAEPHWWVAPWPHGPWVTRTSIFQSSQIFWNFNLCSLPKHKHPPHCSLSSVPLVPIHGPAVVAEPPAYELRPVPSSSSGSVFSVWVTGCGTCQGALGTDSKWLPFVLSIRKRASLSPGLRDHRLQHAPYLHVPEADEVASDELPGTGKAPRSLTRPGSVQTCLDVVGSFQGVGPQRV